MTFNKLLRQIAGSVAAVCLATGALAQIAYPTKPVKIIVPLLRRWAGGHLRALCRRPPAKNSRTTFRDREQARRRRDHRHRRGGEIQPDGYTLLMMSNTAHGERVAVREETLQSDAGSRPHFADQLFRFCSWSYTRRCRRKR